MFGPEDLRGEKLRSLDEDPAVIAAYESLGVPVGGVYQYARKVSGKRRNRSGPELAVWKLRLLAEAGLIEPVHVDLPELPEDASEAAQEMRSGFALLCGLRWLRGDGAREVPFTRRFAGDWLGWHESKAERIKGQLLEKGIIVKVGTDGKTRSSLYLPGG